MTGSDVLAQRGAQAFTLARGLENKLWWRAVPETTSVPAAQAGCQRRTVAPSPAGFANGDGQFGHDGGIQSQFWSLHPCRHSLDTLEPSL